MHTILTLRYPVDMYALYTRARVHVSHVYSSTLVRTLEYTTQYSIACCLHSRLPARLLGMHAVARFIIEILCRERQPSSVESWSPGVVSSSRLVPIPYSSSVHVHSSTGTGVGHCQYDLTGTRVLHLYRYGYSSTRTRVHSVL